MTYQPPPPPPPIEDWHVHAWEVAGLERNFGGGIGWVIQSCRCGEVRRVALPSEYPKAGPASGSDE